MIERIHPMSTSTRQRRLARVSTATPDFTPGQTFWLDHVQNRQDLLTRAKNKARGEIILWADMFSQSIETSHWSEETKLGASDKPRPVTRTTESYSEFTFVDELSLVLSMYIPHDTGSTATYQRMQHIRIAGVPTFTKDWLERYYAASPGRYSADAQAFISPTTTELQAILSRDVTS